MLSNLFGGYRYKKRRRRVTRKKRSRRRSRRSKRYSRKRRSYKNYVPYETAKYDRKSRKLKIYVGDGKFLEYKRMLKHMFREVKFFIREDSDHMKMNSYYGLNLTQIEKWERWANDHAEKYVKKYAGRVRGGKFWEIGMGPGQIVRQLFEDWESRRMR